MSEAEITFTIKWALVPDSTHPFEEYFGMTYNEYQQLSEDEQESLKLQVSDSLREQNILMVNTFSISHSY